MILNTDGTKPIYIQIAEWLEIEIINGNFKPDDKVFSQYQLAEMFNINPATAAKGLNLLADDHILYKKRGLGMFVEKKARNIILTKRKTVHLKQLVLDLVIEADHLGVSDEELIEMVKDVRDESGGKK